MNQINQLHPLPKDFLLKVTLLKSMMYCGVLWGLFHQGWAISSDHDDYIFPFWLNAVQAHKYAAKHWPQYSPRKISAQDFETFLLPTLTRLNVTPTLFGSSSQKIKLTTSQMKHFFFNEPALNTA